MSELVGAGHLGMRAAIDGFDPDQGDIRLSTYAVGWIRHYIQDYIRRHAPRMRLSVSAGQRQLFRSADRLSRTHAVPASAKASSPPKPSFASESVPGSGWVATRWHNAPLWRSAMCRRQIPNRVHPRRRGTHRRPKIR
jgi:hypothetical protein